jgi:hypothetical protein
MRNRATCQRDEFSLCTSKFESDHPSQAVSAPSFPGMEEIRGRIARPGRRREPYRPDRRKKRSVMLVNFSQLIAGGGWQQPSLP